MNKSDREHLAREIAINIWAPVVVFSLLMFLLVGVKWAFDLGRDPTDPEGGRSGMRLHIDAETGVEYLSTPEGGIIERKKP